MKLIFRSVIFTAVYYVITSITAQLSLAYFPPQLINENNLELYNLSSALLSLTIVFATLKRITEQPLLDLAKTEKKYYLIALIIGASFVFLLYPFTSVFNYALDKNIDFGYDFKELNQLARLKWRFLSSVIVHPILEEVFFRGFIQRKLQPKFSFYAIFFSAILFALIHVKYITIMGYSYLHYSQAYHVFWGGLIAGWLFYKSKSIGPPIIFHMSWNLIALIS